MRICCLAVALAVAPASRGADVDDFFETEVRPVLVGSCVGCHGPKKQHGGLRLDSRAAALQGGESGPAVVPGKPESSPLVVAVRRAGELKMPPDKPLDARKVAALARWVMLGAPWPEAKPLAERADHSRSENHWAFRPVKEPTPPPVRDAEWVHSPIDRFILAKLEAEKLTPSPPADRRTLIRRATYDLLGLPPTPEEVDAFVRDESPDAYAKLIDRLLARPQYGEHWGRHWLDVARYADTKGYVYAREERFWVHAWPYRDWVIRSLNDDLPYNRYVALQLAADRVAPDDPAAQAAMGFLTLGRRFIGVTHDIIDDRIDVVTRGLMGLTVACARCHDHKYDPIPTEDYYSLYGVFRSCTERVVPASTDRGSAAFRKELEKLQRVRDDTTAKRRQEAAARARLRVGDYLHAQRELHKYPEEGFDQVFAATDLFPVVVRRWRDYLASDRRDPVFAAWRFLGGPPWLAAAYGEWFARVERYDRAAHAAAVVGAVVIPADPPPLADAARRVLHGPGSPCDVPDEHIADIELYFPTKVIDELWKVQGDVDRHLIRTPTAPAYATVLADRSDPTDARVFRRGNPATPGASVPRQFLAALTGPDRRRFAEGSGRLELANAITDPTNPLTARVMVNRVWMHHFGRGLVATPSDFGTRADPPSHPELLDYLAARFVADGWSLKRLHREIMLSSTYQQSSPGAADPRAARDPGNRLFWAMPARRLSVEEVRDSLFAAAGDLSPAVGGKPVEAYTPPFSPRRAVYGLVDREFFPTLLRTFDAANPDLHTPQRSETAVPQQALFFLNHPLLLDRAATLAKHPTVAAAKAPEEKVAALYRQVYQRPPTASQLEAAVAFVRSADAEAAELANRPPPPPSAWSYGVAAYDPGADAVKGFRPLPHFTGDAWQGGPTWPDPMFGWARLTADGGHAGNDLAHAVVRRWTAPADGSVRVRGEVVHDVAAGDGVRATILSSRHGLLKSAVAHDATVDMSYPAVAVKAGDTLDFVVDIRKGLNSDQFAWAVTVAEGRTGGRAWAAKDGFGGPPPAKPGGWEQLAQTLLMANEFYFVD